MPIYEVEIGGKSYEIEAATPEEAANSAKKVAPSIGKSLGIPQAADLGTETLTERKVSAKEAIYPRTTIAMEDAEAGKDISPLRAVSAPLLDIASLGGRAIVGGITGLVPGGRTFGEGMKSLKGPESETVGGKVVSGLESAIKDPALPFTAPLVGGGGMLKSPAQKPIIQGLKEGVKGAGRSFGRGVLESAPGAAVHQLENVALGREVSPLEAGAELATGGLLETGTGLAKGALKKAISGPGNLSEKIMANYLRPPLKIYDDGFNASNIRKYGLFGNTDEIIAETSRQLKDRSKKLNQLIDNAGKSNEQIDVLGALREAVEDINSNKMDLKQPQIFTPDASGKTPIKKAVNELAMTLKEISGIDPKNMGNIDIKTAQKMKQNIRELADLSYGFGDKDTDALEAVANRTYMNLKKKIEEKLPEEAKKLNKEMSEIIPIQRAAIRRRPIGQRNDVVSLKTANIGAQALTSENKHGALAGGLFAAIDRGLKNPRMAEASSIVGTGTELFGKPVQAVQDVTAFPARQAIRSSLFRPEEEDKKKNKPGLSAFRNFRGGRLGRSY